MLETIRAQLDIQNLDGSIVTVSPKRYLTLDMKDKVILRVTLPKLPLEQFAFRSYKVMLRAQNVIAYVNAGFLFEFDTKKSVKSCRIVYGGINPKFIHAEQTEGVLTGVRNLYSNETLAKCIKSLQSELNPDNKLIDPSPAYRRDVAIGLLYRCIMNMNIDVVKDEYKSGAYILKRPVSSGTQTVSDSNKKVFPVTEPVLKVEGLVQCSGEAIYSNDIFSTQKRKNELWAAYVHCKAVHRKLINIDASKALVKLKNVTCWTKKDS